MAIIGCDIDGCLADFTSAYADLLIFVSGEDKLPEGWRTSPDFPSTWYWERAAGYSKEVEEEVWKRHIIKYGTFWRSLEPLPYASETLTQLNRMAKGGDDVYFLTNRMGYKAKYQTEQWLYEYGFNYPTVILIADKTPIIRALGINFYIDDKLETMNEIMRAAEEERWSPRNFFLKDTPYNREGRRPDLRVVGNVKEGLMEAGLWKE